mgnify:CR=1 FL=1
MKKESNISVLLGAAFLMATSAIGPGFLTQTTVFTGQLGASFASPSCHDHHRCHCPAECVAGDCRSPKAGQDIANMVLPGLGYLVSAFVVFGGLAFNIGNLGGAGLGLNVLFGISPIVGALISAAIAIFIFSSKEAGT